MKTFARSKHPHQLFWYWKKIRAFFKQIKTSEVNCLHTWLLQLTTFNRIKVALLNPVSPASWEQFLQVRGQVSCTTYKRSGRSWFTVVLNCSLIRLLSLWNGHFNFMLPPHFSSRSITKSNDLTVTFWVKDPVSTSKSHQISVSTKLITVFSHSNIL